MSQSPKKRQKLDFSTTVKVLVGKDEKSFVLHLSYANKNSEYFRKATNGTWKEAADSSISLPDHDPEVFRAYTEWLYTGEIDFDGELTPESAAKAKGKIAEMQAQLAELYILAQYLIDQNCQNAIIDAMIAASTFEIPGADIVKRVWDETVKEDSGMKRLIVRYWAKKMAKDRGLDIASTLPSDFIGSLLYDMAGARDARETWLPNSNFACDYHDHDEATPKGVDCKAAKTPMKAKAVGKKVA